MQGCSEQRPSKIREDWTVWLRTVFGDAAKVKVAQAVGGIRGRAEKGPSAGGRRWQRTVIKTNRESCNAESGRWPRQGGGDVDDDDDKNEGGAVLRSREHSTQPAAVWSIRQVKDRP